MNPRYTPGFQARMDDVLRDREAELRATLAEDNDIVRHEHDRTEVYDSEETADADTRAIVDEAVAARTAIELEAVTAARRRIAGGTYGTCVSCGEPIEERRLLALPAAPLCAECQSQLE